MGVPALLLLACLVSDSATASSSGPPPDPRVFFDAASLDEKKSKAALETLARSWRDGYAGMVVDVARSLRSSRRPFETGGNDTAGEDLADAMEPRTPAAGRPDSTAQQPIVQRDPSSLARARLIRFLERQTGRRFGDDLRAWRRWIWSRPYEPHPDLLSFKAALYSRVDPRMASFFAPGGAASIRLDEVDWGGVKINGIPPLDHPKHVAAAEARYLKEDHVVFGVALNGEARAYPKRILAWHEMALDELGRTELTIVYCTLCGTVIPYGSEVGGEKRTFGTSGLLYRSNKLMFDRESLTLWSSVEGRPVIGPLAGSDLELTAYPVVTTTWREWRAAHPETTVLSLETGFERDYSEGAAYRDYFSTDLLMFEIPRDDGRLKNKAEVLTLLLSAPGTRERQPLAFSIAFLKKNPLHQLNVAGQDLVVITSRDGANRVYASAGVRFVSRSPDGRLMDSNGAAWLASEEAIESARDGSRLARVPARRAFWFGWHAQFPETALVR